MQVVPTKPHNAYAVVNVSNVDSKTDNKFFVKTELCFNGTQNAYLKVCSCNPGPAEVGMGAPKTSIHETGSKLFGGGAYNMFVFETFINKKQDSSKVFVDDNIQSVVGMYDLTFNKLILEICLAKRIYFVICVKL